ncbi:MAG: hypothetical protein NDJ72_05310 [Elusimicrobia bacterium]|nr:hypothetical protein [Elusimicrobiota bacterium]
MIRVIAAALVFAGMRPVYADLPDLKVPEKFYQCRQDDDCAVAGDSCRSCGKLIIINKKFLKTFDALDQKARRKNKIQRACEACSTKHAVLKCEKNKCIQKPETP